MRINKYIAQASGLSRRAADAAIASGRVIVNNRPPAIGQQVSGSDIILLDGHTMTLPEKTTVLLLNKPEGYICSRSGQGQKTIYDLLPKEFHSLKPVGRLDKDSSGLLLLTDDGLFANSLTHPSFIKEKIYIVTLDKPLATTDSISIGNGIQIDDYMSNLKLDNIEKNTWRVTMSQGRNRQIRRTFSELGYHITTLQRVAFGDFKLGGIALGSYEIEQSENQNHQ